MVSQEGRLGSSPEPCHPDSPSPRRAQRSRPAGERGLDGRDTARRELGRSARLRSRANALRARSSRGPADVFWSQRNMNADISSQLLIGGVPASDLAAEYGTPLYVYDANSVRAAFTRVRNATPYWPLKV